MQKFHRIHEYKEVVRKEISPLLPAYYSVVVDMGCGAGFTGEWLKHNREDIEVIGVEINPAFAADAQKRLNKVFLLDIEQGTKALESLKGRVDLLLLLDILEHLRDPWQLLSEVKNLLSPTGVVVASIPNVRNLKLLFPLIFYGQWNYEAAGILDRTHLRFFTKSSIINLFRYAGYEIQYMLETGPINLKNIKSLGGGLAYFLNKISFGLLQNFIVHQYIIRAVPSN